MAATWLFMCAILGTTLPSGTGEKVLGRETDEFDFDGLPGASHEFKTNVAAGREECFFQNIVAGAKLHVSFEVLSSGDNNIDLKVWTPQANLFYHIQVSASAGFEQEVLETGPYAICLDNSVSRINSKLVYVYLVTYVPDEWHQYVREIEDLHITMSNFTASIEQVKNSISDALIHQAQSRMHVIKDWYLIVGNNKYIQNWSILQCCVIIVSACCQVYFVRRLFRYTNVKPAKPRA